MSIAAPALAVAVTVMPRARRVVMLVLIVVASAAIASAEPPMVLVEDWSRQTIGAAGVPEGWQGHDWGSPRYDFTVVADGPRKVLRMRSESDNSTISKEVRIAVKQFPILVWRWKVVTLPAKADSRHRETDDQAAQVYVTFPRFPERVRSRIARGGSSSSSPTFTSRWSRRVRAARPRSSAITTSSTGSTV